MKKFLVFALLLCASFNLYAQDGKLYKWLKDTTKGDEMLGTTDSYTYTYATTEMLFLFDSDLKSTFIISSFDGIFDYQYVSYLKEDRISGRVGFYDINNNFIKSESCPFTPSRGSSDIARSKVNYDLGKEILAYIQDSTGYVRFILPRYGNTNLDAKIPCMHNPEDKMK